MKNLWVTKAVYVKDFELSLEFNNGTKGIVDLKDRLNKPIFKPLQSKEYFSNFKLGSWTVEWENGADFAPEFLYEQIRRAELAK